MGCFSIWTSKFNPKKAEPQPRQETKAPVTSSLYAQQSGGPTHSHQACCSFEPLPAYESSDKSHSHGRLQEKHQSDPFSPVMESVAKIIEETIHSLDSELRELSLKMWDNPEIMWEEK